MSRIRFKLLAIQLFMLYTFYLGTSIASAAPLSNTNLNTELDAESLEWINRLREQQKWKLNANPQNEWPHINVVSGKSKEWSNLEHSRPLKRSENIHPDLLKKTPFLADDCFSNSAPNTSKFPCPINLLYGNNLTVKNFFLMMPMGNRSCKDQAVVEPSSGEEKHTNPQPSLEPGLTNLGAFSNPEISTKLVTSTNSPLSEFITLKASVTDVNSSLMSEALLTNMDFNSTSFYYTLNENSIVTNEVGAKPTTEINPRLDVSSNWDKSLENSPVSNYKLSENSTTSSVDTANMMQQTTANVNTTSNMPQEKNASTVQLFTLPANELTVTPTLNDNSPGNASLRDEILRTLDKYCVTLNFNLTDNGNYPVSPVAIPHQIGFNEFIDTKYSMKR